MPTFAVAPSVDPCSRGARTSSTRRRHFQSPTSSTFPLLSYIPNPLIIPIGLIVGMLIAAPVGPVNVLCIQRAIERGFWGGIAAGIGSVMGDALIALCAGLGVGSISGVVETHRAVIQLIGGLALVAFGL